MLSSADPAAAQLEGTVHRRVTRVSAIEFALHNSGMFYGTNASVGWAPFLMHWPRGSYHMIGWGASGVTVLAKKQGRLLVSDAYMINSPLNFSSPSRFSQYVPGWIGDPLAPYDTTFGKSGWRYVDRPDFVVYSSLDYDSTGRDISGSNLNDWPLRESSTGVEYIPDPLARSAFRPVVVSDEDLFMVFKDTDSRADLHFSGPEGPSVPIGAEIRLTVHTWGIEPIRNSAVFVFDIVNRSGVALDSCHLVFGAGLNMGVPGTGPVTGFMLRQHNAPYTQDPSRRLAVLQATYPPEWPRIWRATPRPPTIGVSVLASPRDYTGGESRMYFAGGDGNLFYAPLDSGRFLYLNSVSDSVQYRMLTHPQPRLVEPFPVPDTSYSSGPMVGVGPFSMATDTKARFAVTLTFADSLAQLLLLDDLLKRMYALGLQRPAAPPAPRLQAEGLRGVVKLNWDRGAEGAVDAVIPDSLGRPFAGYRLLRAFTAEGPWTEIGRWHRDTLLAHEYLDTGSDIPGGLRTTVRYYYRLLSFDEGAVRLKLAPMESAVKEGVNSISVVPEGAVSELQADSSKGALVSGTLGDVGLPELVPRSAGSFGAFFSGRSLGVRIGASTDGVRYSLPVTVTDSTGGRTLNTVIELPLEVHGSPETAGVKEGRTRIADLFGLGGADLVVPWRFEQLDSRFRMEPVSIEGGADVPLIAGDSTGTTGIRRYAPETSGEREVVVEFLPGGLDTVSVLFGRIFPYLNLRVRDAATSAELLHGRDYTWTGSGIRQGMQLTTRPNRYYLTGTTPTGQVWEFGHLFSHYNSAVALDYPDRGRGSTQGPPYFQWQSGGRRGTRDMQAGDRVRIGWRGGVRGRFPQDAVTTVTGTEARLGEVTQEMLERIRVVPNPYIIRHAAQRERPVVSFTNLPTECTIRIYTVALDLVAVVEHREGSRQEWDLLTSGGQLVASQLLLARIDTPNGLSVTKKFAVVVGR